MKVFFFLALLLAASGVQGQRGLRLTNRFSGRQKFISNGSRVVYNCIDRSRPMVMSNYRFGSWPVYQTLGGAGTLKIVSDSAIQVDNEVMLLKDLTLIGSSKKGANVGANILCWGGMTMGLIGSADHDPYGKMSDAGVVMALTGLSCEIIGIVDLANRLPKVTSSWRVEVIY